MEGEQTLLNWLISAKSQHRRRVFIAGTDGELMPTYLLAIPEWYVDAEIERIMKNRMMR